MIRPPTVFHRRALVRAIPGPGRERGVRRALSALLAGMCVFLASPDAVAHEHRRRHVHHVRHPQHHVAALPRGWAVPQGLVAADGLVLSSDAPRLVEWDGLTATLQAAATARPPVWASVLVDGTQAGQACAAGWVRHLEGTTGCTFPGGYEDIALAWDRSRLTSPPHWSSFWDVARQPGRRGLFRGARTTLEIALMADGVSAADVYTQLATAEGVDRAFRKLDILRPYIVWWRTGEEAARIMEHSGALMTSAPVSEITSVGLGVKAGVAGSLFVAAADERLRTNLFWTIPATASDKDARETQERLRLQSPRLHTPVTVVGSPGDTMLTVDDAFWLEHGPALEKRFGQWYAEAGK